MNAEPLLVETLLQSLADGVPIDWGALESPAVPEHQRLLRHLRLVAGVAEVHRTVVSEPLASTRWPEAGTSGAAWGHLSLLERIGQGAFGEVYRARDSWLDREVALKLLKPDIANRVPASRIVEEARALARLRHPNVVTVHGADIHDGRVGLWMELVAGQTLAQMLAAQGPFSAAEAAAVGQEVCRALVAVHAAGIVHRDIKAQNVMREAGGRIVLMDFGAGGTPIYLAPEVLGGGQPTVASDLYAVGVLLFHLATGRFPIQASTSHDLAAAHARGARLALSEVRPDLPDAFVDVVERALDPDPAGRFVSAGEMRHALARSTASQLVASHVPAPAPHGMGARRRLTLAVVTLVAALCAGAALTIRGDPNAGIEVIAVLPFENVSQGPDEAHLATGVTMELSARLAELGALRVVPWTFTRRFGPRATRLPDIVKATGADTVVEGSIQLLAGGGGSRRVRVRVQLYRAASGSLIWTSAYERDLEDLLVLQSDVAQSIARQINVIVARREALRLGQVRRVSAETMDAYLKARELLEGKNDIRAALESFRFASERDPTFAAAFVGLATCYALESAFLGEVPSAAALERSIAASDRAIAIDPSMPEAFAARGFARLALAWDWPAAESAFERARQLGPNNAAVHDSYSNYLTVRGRHDEAILAARHAENRAPLSVAYSRKVGWALYMARRYGEAQAQLEKTLAIDPDYLPARTLLGRTLLFQDRFDEALTEATKTGWAPLSVAALSRSGRMDQSTRLVDQLPTMRSPRSPTPYEWAVMFAELGRLEEALEQLHRAYESRDPALAHLAVDPLLDPLRRAPAFADLLRKMALVP